MSVGISGEHPVPQAGTCGNSRTDGRRQAAGAWEARKPWETWDPRLHVAFLLTWDFPVCVLSVGGFVCALSCNW